MKKSEFTQIKGLDIGELFGKVKAIKKEIADLVLDINMKKLKDIKTISKKKKDLAKILTMIKQKKSLMELESKTKVKESTNL